LRFVAFLSDANSHEVDYSKEHERRGLHFEHTLRVVQFGTARCFNVS
jgi:hypothetical protein